MNQRNRVPSRRTIFRTSGTVFRARGTTFARRMSPGRMGTSRDIAPLVPLLALDALAPLDRRQVLASFARLHRAPA